MLKVDVGSLIGVLAFVSAIFLAIVVILFNDLGRGLRLDRHLIITRVLHLPYFVILTTVLCGLFFAVIWGETLESVWLHRAFWLLAVIMSSVYFTSAILILIFAIAWLNSEEYSSLWRDSYREEKRLKYLTAHDYARTLPTWREFWHDEKTYIFLGNGHFLPYIEAFFNYLLEIPPEYKTEAGELFCDFTLAMWQMQQRKDVELEHELFGRILIGYEQAYLRKSYQLDEWGKLVHSYLTVMRLQNLAALGIEEEAVFLRENPEFISNGWQDAFDFYLTDGFCLQDKHAVRALARIIWQYYHEGSQEPTELKSFFRARRALKSKTQRRLYSELSKAVDATDSRSLAEFLIAQIKSENSNK